MVLIVLLYIILNFKFQSFSFSFEVDKLSVMQNILTCSRGSSFIAVYILNKKTKTKRFKNLKLTFIPYNCILCGEES